MNKLRFGNPEYAILFWIISLVPILIVMGSPIYMLAKILLFFSMIFSCFAVCWLPYLISKNHLRAGIDRCKPNETTWLRISKDHIIHPQFVDKGPYGQTKGLMYKEKADVIDDGSFPVKWLNGNPGIVMYDLINTSVDLNKSVARKIMKKKYGIRSGIDGYKKAKKDEKVMHPD